MNKRFSWLVALPVVLLTNVSPASSEKVLLAGFFDDLGDTVEDSVEKEVNGIFGSEDNSTEKPQREDREPEPQEQRQRQIQTSENESIELERSTNPNSASSDAKTGTAVNDLTLFCDLDYATEVAEATSQSEIQSITSEARDNNCLLEAEAGSELTYQYLGEEEHGIVLVAQNNNGQPYVGITQAKNIQTEEQLSDSSSSDTVSSSESSRENNESIKVEQWTLDKMKQILAKRTDETHEEWYHRTEKARYGLYGAMIPKEQMQEWQNTLTGVDATEYKIRSEEIARQYERNDRILNGAIEGMLGGSGDSTPSGGNPNTTTGCEHHELGTYPNCQPNPDAF
jgi:hypothetical protein